MRQAWVSRVGMVALVGTLTTPLAAQAGSFTGLGDLAGGSFFSKARGVSADGAAVVGFSNSGNGTEAFRWTSGGGMVGLGDLAGGSFYSQARGVSGDGAVVVGHSNVASGYEGYEAFRWTSGGGMVGLGDLVGGVFYSQATGVSDDGSAVVGVSISGSGYEAFRWTSGGGMVGLGDLAGGGFHSMAYGVSADGAAVVGFSNSGNGAEAFRWTSGGGMVGLGVLAGGGSHSEALGVSADGATVVGYGNINSGSGTEAFRWTSGGGMVGLGNLAGGIVNSSAVGVSGDGQRVVGFGYDTTGQTAFLWDPINGMRDLQTVLETDEGLAAALAGWTLREAFAISEDGTWIVGWGTNPSGQTEAFRAQISKQPTNQSPDCTTAVANPASLWSPNHQFVPVVVMGVTDTDGDSVTITVTGVTQDEPVNAKGDGNTSPDAVIEAGAASVRAERSGKGNGRVYQISFKADDGQRGFCTGKVTVSVPHSMGKGITAIDDGQNYDSTIP